MLCVGGSSSRAERAEELKATNKEEWPSESLSAWGEMREGGGEFLTFPHLKKVGATPYSVETSFGIMLPPTNDVKNVQKLLDHLKR